MVEKGLFIVIEGIDNSGKTTQSGLLKEYLEGKGLPVVQTREPGGTEVGEEIREILLKKRDKMMDPQAQALLFYAARVEFLKSIVEPNLSSGVTVITDRFEPSTYVYQGYTQGATDFVQSLSRLVVGYKYQPDVSVVLDIPAEESFRRRSNEDRQGQDLIYEHQGLEFSKKLREGYLDYTKEHPNAVLLDGTEDIKSVHERIILCIKPKLIAKGIRGIHV